MAGLVPALVGRLLADDARPDHAADQRLWPAIRVRQGSAGQQRPQFPERPVRAHEYSLPPAGHHVGCDAVHPDSDSERERGDRKSTRLNSSHTVISYAVFCLKKKKKYTIT